MLSVRSALESDDSAQITATSLISGKRAPQEERVVTAERVDVVEGGKVVRTSNECSDDRTGSSDHDDDSDEGESDCDETPDGKMGKFDVELFAETTVIESSEFDSTDDLLRRIGAGGDDSDGQAKGNVYERSEIAISSATSPIVHDTFGKNNIWKPEINNNNGSSSSSSSDRVHPDVSNLYWDYALAIAPPIATMTTGRDGSYLGTSLDEVLEFNRRCERERQYGGLERTRRQENESNVVQGVSTEARNDAARRALELAIASYPREAGFICHQLLQNLTNENVVIQPETYDLMVRAAEVSGHRELTKLLYDTAGRRPDDQSTGVRLSSVPLPSPPVGAVGSSQLRLYPVVNPAVPGRGDHLAPMTRSLDALCQQQRTFQLAAVAAAAAYRQQEQYQMFAAPKTVGARGAGANVSLQRSSVYDFSQQAPFPPTTAALELMYQRQQQQQQFVMMLTTGAQQQPKEANNNNSTTRMVPSRETDSRV
ncbi:hypothetical protein Pmar_PMAR004366 [Perkinsus marinus ATCC 50983]|uniref:Uncharacterized protein n=1 Tax=Perkinsus marinus (strain ATCC 50983 / TXsc) TaxID=423536 RepID=C5KAH0_PERM5|nr:hypothetical protein Pmar_PMAR004366 [Perkinsus marinus ATCC 50983]EER18506.1 hypothetical protein Pmar_PMAR004366 [Perkinsus marinus ATCC 50983]|eukprot:XP_002786710.1 hypothetical protein Pmar_PMAR004366 [Perkinsus marinus ATCC 50983]